jgi:antitoxin component YwqK of YwqJK toxin-antitoxin module
MVKAACKFIIVAAIFISLFINFSCREANHPPESKLELKDSLIYQKGSDTPFTGREYARIENKIIEYDVVNGVKNGEFRLYYEDGELEIKGNLVNNMNEGRWQYFYESGQVESEGDFIDNLPEGTWRWFYRSGNLREEGLFQKGKRIGLWKQFDEMGTVIEEKEYLLSDSLNTGTDLMDKLKNQIDQQ